MEAVDSAVHHSAHSAVSLVMVEAATAMVVWEPEAAG